MNSGSQAASIAVATGAARQEPGAGGGPLEGIKGLTWSLQQFVADAQGVTHAVLVSRDGLVLLDSGVEKDWADELAAGVSGIISITANLTGPDHGKADPRQVVIERDDCFLLLQYTGSSAAFRHQGRLVDTILAVVAAPSADMGTVGYEMGRLVDRFAPYMDVPVRAADGSDGAR